VITARRATRLDMYYLVTAWATAPEDEHRLLARTLMTFLRYPELPDEALPASLLDQPNPIPLKVAQPDTLDKPSDLWSVLDNQMRLGFLMVATIELDIELAIEAPLVLEASLWVGQSEVPPDEELSALDIILKHKAKKPKQEGKDGE